MKRTVITIKTINDNKIKSQNRILLKESESWNGHGTIAIKMKDFVPVDASVPVNKLVIEKIDTGAYIQPENEDCEKKT
jgi:hypothetical protein